MELALNVDYLNGTTSFKDARLRDATLEIANNLQKSKESFVKAGLTMQRIIEEELYKKDFFDADGKPSFAMYSEMVLGISKTAAYRIISVTKKLLYPELSAKAKPEYFKNFADSTLGVLANNKLGDYDGVKKFCDAYEITETTPRSDVEKYVKAYTRKENPCKTLDEYNTELDEKENEKNSKDESSENTDDETTTENEIETLPYTVGDLLYAQQAANIVAAIMDDLSDILDNSEEINILKQFVKRFIPHNEIDAE